jgi:hypothetical protein
MPSTSTARTSPYRCFEGEASGEARAPEAEAEAMTASLAAASDAASLSMTLALRRPSGAAGSIRSGA